MANTKLTPAHEIQEGDQIKYKDVFVLVTHVEFTRSLRTGDHVVTLSLNSTDEVCVLPVNWKVAVLID